MSYVEAKMTETGVTSLNFFSDTEDARLWRDWILKRGGNTIFMSEGLFPNATYNLHGVKIEFKSVQGDLPQLRDELQRKSAQVDLLEATICARNLLIQHLMMQDWSVFDRLDYKLQKQLSLIAQDVDNEVDDDFRQRIFKLCEDRDAKEKAIYLVVNNNNGKISVFTTMRQAYSYVSANGGRHQFDIERKQLDL